MGTTRVGVVVDESSSMWSLQRATIDGFNEYIDELKKDSAAAEETTVSLTKFSGVPVVIYTDKPLLQVERLNDKTYSPNGSTALYDAIALTVGQLAPRVGADDTAIILVQTDGYENSSVETTANDVVNLIQEKESLGNWTFVYLGADQDAFTVGTSIGFRGGNTLSYAGTAQGTSSTYANLASNTVSLRGKTRSGLKTNSSSFLTEDQDDEDTGSQGPS